MIERIKELRQQLNAFEPKTILQLLERVENQLTLDELETCYEGNADTEELTARLTTFFSTRWDRIRNTGMCYTQQPGNSVNQLCVDIAREAVTPNTSPWSLLMPSLEITEDLYGGNIDELRLHEFILSDNERLYIPLGPCLDRSPISDSGLLLHVGSIDGGWPELLTPGEVDRVRHHSKEAAEYYEAILAYNNQRLAGKDIGAKLSELAMALRNGGAHRGGTEFEAGSDADLGIHAFSEYWERLSKHQQAAIYASVPELKDVIGRLFRPDDPNYSSVRYCVELIADEIDPIVSKLNKRPALERLLDRVNEKKARFYAAAKSPDGLSIIPSRNAPKPVLHHIFKLKNALLKRNALIYILTLYPELLPEFDQDLNDKLKQKAISTQLNPNGETALMVATRKGALSAIDLLLTWGAPIEAQDNAGCTALHWASIYGRAEVVELLLQKNANINVRNADTDNALDLAIAKHPHLIEPLLIHLAKLPLAIQFECLLKTTGGLSSNVFFYAAAKKPDLFNTLIKQTLEQEPPDEELREAVLKATDDNGFTAMHWASRNGDVDSVKLLLKNGADLEATTDKKYTPLNLAVYYGKKAMVNLLLQKNANLDTKNEWNLNPLDTAIKHQPQLINTILTHIATLPVATQAAYLRYASDIRYPNVFHYAAATKPALFKTLIKTALDQQPPDEELRNSILCATDNYGETALHWAAINNDVDSIDYLLAHGANLEATTNRGNTALNIAVYKGNEAAVELLLQKNANLDARNIDGINAVQYARTKPEIFKPILMHLLALPPNEQHSYLSTLAGKPYDNIYAYINKEEPGFLGAMMINSLTKLQDDTSNIKTLLDQMHFDEHLNRIYKHYQVMLKKGARNPDYEEASSAARTLLITCIKAVDTLLQSPAENNTKLRTFQSSCQKAITEAKPVLEKERGWGKVIAKFLLAVITLPISLPLYAAGFFSLKTKSAQLTDKFQDDINPKRTLN